MVLQTGRDELLLIRIFGKRQLSLLPIPTIRKEYKDRGATANGHE
jgi:hypothetical protein